MKFARLIAHLALALVLGTGRPGWSAPELKPYLGTLHDHTAEGGDDGTGTVQDALEAAKKNGFHFLGLSPHDHMVADEAYESLKAQVAAAEEPGTFIPFAAYEWGVIKKGGHVGVVGSAHINRSTSADWASFWDGLVGDAADPVVVLNHPVWNHTFGGRPTEERAGQAHLIEVTGGPSQWKVGSPERESEFSHDEYMAMLNQGWRSGVAHGEDNHTGTWGEVNGARTGVWAPELTRAALMDSFRARRTFVTQDPAMDIWIQSGNTAMGSVAPFAPGRVQVKVRNGHEAIESLAVFFDADGPGGEPAVEVRRGAGNELTVELSPGAAGAYALAMAQDASGDLCWSSPIWFGASASFQEPVELRRPRREGPPDVNFAPPRTLNKVTEGRGDAIRDALVRGVVFYTMEDLLQVTGITPEVLENLRSRVRVGTPDENLASLLEYSREGRAFVISASMRRVYGYLVERAEKLVARGLEDHLRAGRADAAGALRSALEAAGPPLDESRRHIFQLMRARSLSEAPIPGLDVFLSPESPR